MTTEKDRRIPLSRKRLELDLREKHTLPTVPIGCLVVSAALFFLGMQNRDSFGLLLTLSLCSLAACAFSVFLTAREREKTAAQVAALRSGDFFFVQNRLTDKESTDASSGDSPAASPSWLLFFNKTAAEGRRKLPVDRATYQAASVGEKYYLLFLNKELVRAYPSSLYRLDAELEQMLVKDPELVGIAQISEYERYQKLERQVGALARRQWLKTHGSVPERDQMDGR